MYTPDRALLLLWLCHTMARPAGCQRPRLLHGDSIWMRDSDGINPPLLRTAAHIAPNSTCKTLPMCGVAMPVHRWCPLHHICSGYEGDDAPAP